VVDIGTASVTDAHNLKIYMIDGREHLKITVMGNSFYTHSSELKIFASSAIYLHDIQGRVLGQ